MNTPKKAILQKGQGKTRKLAKLEYIYERESRYFAQVAESVKDLALKEIQDLGGNKARPVFRGIWFEADKSTFYKIVYLSRLVSRVLVPLVEFDCKDKDALYKGARTIRWEEFLTPKKTFSIAANVSESQITHSNFAGLRVKDAIADYFRDRTNRRPSVDTEAPWIMINVHVHKDRAAISIDAGSGPLHKRGYREARVSAPMQETVAAAIIALSGWQGEEPLLDPMCGSGTLLCEALMHYSRIPAQIFREQFGFERLPDFDAREWEAVKAAANEAIRPLPKGLIRGSDIAETSVDATRTNLMGLHHGGQIDVDLADFRQLDTVENAVIVTNPPYGIRMGKDQNMKLFYKDLGRFLKEQCKSCTAYVYFGDPGFIKHVPLAPSWKKNLEIGGLDGKLVKYQLY
ncbi:THUMP domain-containing class I SAM-dependent RNA methyltransferase [Desulfobacter vibrioformis]|uniref:THUMP domain-containing class I SAM-dependent RNA methyltransferase n=1 Tax=Desulfobacter vibrioformis TaxID=34031 RepID=UPI0005598D8D|nr:THUMP domain-containing protein [Desulfobacter vibrioformis]